MSLKDAPSSRSEGTAMRDLLRRLERQANRYSPARPTEPPAMFTLMAPAPATVSVGGWLLHEDPDTGDLMATDPDGATHTLLTKGTP